MPEGVLVFFRFFFSTEGIKRKLDLIIQEIPNCYYLSLSRKTKKPRTKQLGFMCGPASMTAMWEV